jgi:hypothetical protein
MEKENHFLLKCNQCDCEFNWQTSCGLICQALNQADWGGFSNQDISQPYGPYWKLADWLNFINRTIQAAKKANCNQLSSNQLNSLLKNITYHKEQQQTLVL